MKLFKSLSVLLFASALAFGFISCKNDDDDGTPSTQGTGAVSTTGEVTGATTNASGQKTVTLNGSNGSYFFTETNSGASASIVFRAAVDTTKGGTWTFTEKDTKIPKYFGSYKGDISKFTSEEVKLGLTVEKEVNNQVSLMNLTDMKNFDFNASVSTFNAEIPAVEAEKLVVTLPESSGENPLDLFGNQGNVL